MNVETTTEEELALFQRIVTPHLTKTQRKIVELYCQRYHQKFGPGVLFAALREMRRELGIPEGKGIESMGKTI